MRLDDIAIIGGGASGLACAVVAAREMSCAKVSAAKHSREKECTPARITIYETTDKTGRSILRSGNGRCNFTNANISNFTKEDFCNTYHNGCFVFDFAQNLEQAWSAKICANTQSGAGRAQDATDMQGDAENMQAATGTQSDAGRIHRATGHAQSATDIQRATTTQNATTHENSNAVLNFFESLGLVWRKEPDGRAYPLSGKASTVLNLLRAHAKKLGVREVVNTRISRIEPRGNSGFILHTEDGQMLHAHRVVLAAGGKAAPNMLRDVSTSYTQTTPVLAPLALRETKVTRALDNIRVKCSVSLVRGGRKIETEHGEVLFRKYGASGIAVFNLSRFAQAKDVLSINLLGGINESEAEKTISNIAKYLTDFMGEKPNCAEVLRGVLQDGVAREVMRTSGILPESKSFSVRDLAHALCNFEFSVLGAGDAKLAQVQRGGFSTSNINPKTMEVLGCSGLHITGEALDIDAPCGGFNLHWAWSSGMLAGLACANCSDLRQSV